MHLENLKFFLQNYFEFTNLLHSKWNNQGYFNDPNIVGHQLIFHNFYISIYVKIIKFYFGEVKGNTISNSYNLNPKKPAWLYYTDYINRNKNQRKKKIVDFFHYHHIDLKKENKNDIENKFFCLKLEIL